MARRHEILLTLIDHPEGITIRKLQAEMGMPMVRWAYNHLNLLLNQMRLEGLVTSEGMGRGPKRWRLQGAVCRECGRPW